ncbi:MAG: Rpn family recombination-promoting nuclease/putative transposase, partial [Gordonia sp. (in: high G+C Gram-positive bacteria)]
MDTGGTSDFRGQPHDALFRRVLGRPEHAGSELRSILPAEVVSRIDLDSLSLQPGTFVDDHLRHRHTDLLFQATIDDRDGYLYVLLEHQRTPDPLMAYRMLGYQAQIWSRHLSEAAKAGEPEPRSLPVVIPIVIYQGE